MVSDGLLCSVETPGRSLLFGPHDKVVAVSDSLHSPISDHTAMLTVSNKTALGCVGIVGPTQAQGWFERYPCTGEFTL